MCTCEITLFSDIVGQSEAAARKLLRISFSFAPQHKIQLHKQYFFNPLTQGVINDVPKEFTCYFRQWTCAQTNKELDEIAEFKNHGN